MAIVIEERFNLSYGALQRILDGEALDNVILQILGHKKIPGSNSTRFRLLLNDGVVLFPYAILATQLNNLIYDNHLEKFTIFKLKNYAFNQLVASKKVIICIDIEILVPGCDVNFKISEGNVNISGRVPDLNESLSMSLLEGHPPFNVDTRPSTSGIAQNWDIATSSTNVFSHANKSKDAHISPISSLSPYRRKWTIKARVSYKTAYIKYNKGHQQGKYFSFHLLDSSGEIRATAFNEIAEKFYDSLDVFKIYLISNGNVKRAQENDLIKNDFDIVIESNTEIEPYIGLMSSVPMPTFNFQTIRQISSLPKDSNADVIGICHQISDVNIIITKSNKKEIFKRDISLIDSSKMPINVTLWDANAENFPSTGNPIIAIKNAKVTNYGGLSLNTSYKSMIYIDPKINKAFELKSWFRTFNSLFHTVCSSESRRETSENWKTLAEMFTEMNNSVNTPLYYTLKATIVMVKKEKCLYQACSSPGCSKKVIDLKNGLFRCEKCNLNCDTFSWSLCLLLEVADFTGSHWVTAFAETAEILIGMTCDELSKIKNESKDKFYDILDNLNFKTFTFKMKSHIETFNNDKRLKTVILNFCPVNLNSFTKMVLSNIKKISRILNTTS